MPLHRYFLLLALLFPTLLLAQRYAPEGARWRGHEYQDKGQYNLYPVYFAQADTLIDSLWVHRIAQDSINGLVEIRLGSIGHRLYHLHDSVPVLLYDFLAHQPGDTVLVPQVPLLDSIFQGNAYNRCAPETARFFAPAIDTFRLDSISEWVVQGDTFASHHLQALGDGDGECHPLGRFIWIDGPVISPEWFFPYRFPALAEGGSLVVAAPDAPVILYFHGNGELASDYDMLAPLYTAKGITLLVADYRGYGRSGGTPTRARCPASNGS